MTTTKLFFAIATIAMMISTASAQVTGLPVVQGDPSDNCFNLSAVPGPNSITLAAKALQSKCDGMEINVMLLHMSLGQPGLPTAATAATVDRVVTVKAATNPTPVVVSPASGIFLVRLSFLSSVGAKFAPFPDYRYSQVAVVAVGQSLPATATFAGIPTARPSASAPVQGPHQLGFGLTTQSEVRASFLQFGEDGSVNTYEPSATFSEPGGGSGDDFVVTLPDAFDLSREVYVSLTNRGGPSNGQSAVWKITR